MHLGTLCPLLHLVLQFGLMDKAVPLWGGQAPLPKSWGSISSYPEEYDICQLSPRLPLQNPIIPQTLNRASNAKPRVPPVTGQFLFILPGPHKAYMWNGNLTGQGKGSTGRETK